MAKSAGLARGEPPSPLLYGVFTKACYSILFEEGRLLDDDSVACHQAILAKLAGFGIIVASILLKLPQIIKIVSSGSVAGLSPTAMYSETIGMMLHASYNWLIGSPLSSYGEMLCILAQNFVLVALLWKYTPDKVRPSLIERIGIVTIFATILTGVFLLPADYLWLVPFCNMPITLMSRVPQIYTNMVNGHTGQLAAITLFLNFVGVVVRVLTTIQEVGLDVGMLSSYALSVLVNGILVFQVMYYWKATEKFTAGMRSGKKKTKRH